MAAVIILPGCTTEEGERAARKLAEAQQVEDSVTTSRAILEDENQELSDRLRRLEAERESLSRELDQLGRLQRDEGVLESRAAEDSLAAAKVFLQSKRESLEAQLVSVQDSLEKTEVRLAQTGSELDSLSLREKFVSGMEGQATAELRSGVEEIDQTLDELARERRSAEQEVLLANKRIAIVEMKIQAFKEERELYIAEKNELMRARASEAELRGVDLKIDEIDNSIGLEESKLSIATLTIRNAEGRIASIDQTVEKLQGKISRQYDRKAILEDFILDEAGRLEEERARLEADRKRLWAQERDLARERQELGRRLSDLSDEIRILEGGPIEEVESRMADLEEEEADVSAEESVLHADRSRERDEAVQKRDTQTTETDTTAAGRLAQLSKEVAQEKAEVARDEATVAREREEISKKKAAERRGGSVGGLGLFIAIVFVLVIVGLFGLFFVGKASRLEKTAS
jgi:chromosome segregation ATPase